MGFNSALRELNDFILLVVKIEIIQ
jgi:hypothetical protein